MKINPNEDSSRRSEAGLIISELTAEHKKRGASDEAPLQRQDVSCPSYLEAVASAAVFAAAETSTPPATTTGASFLGLRFIDGELPAIHVRAV